MEDNKTPFNLEEYKAELLANKPKPEDEQAFPNNFNLGMSKRLYIAAQLLKECVAKYENHFDIVSVTKWSYEVADDLLRQENL
jgi:hypothetical protein